MSKKYKLTYKIVEIYADDAGMNTHHGDDYDNVEDAIAAFEELDKKHTKNNSMDECIEFWCIMVNYRFKRHNSEKS